MIAARGVHGLSLRALARELGATTGLVSHHFLDRAELVEAALHHAAQVIIERLREVPTPAQPIDLLAMVLPTDAVTEENWRFALSVRCAALFDESLARHDRAITDMWEASLPALMADHVDGDPAIAACHLVALVDGIALRAVLDPPRWDPATQLSQLRTGLASLTRPNGNP